VTPPTLLDTGPLVAVLDRRDHYHLWATAQVAHLTTPLLTCEAVLTEACYLVRKLPNGPASLMDFVNQRLLLIRFRLEDEAVAIARLLAKYADVPMSLADACLVRMAEQHSQSVVFTLDSDFKRYRKHGRQVIPTLMPHDQ
jgi:predicted nucleic acid-binding protein